jgi:hypothetical protein
MRSTPGSALEVSPPPEAPDALADADPEADVDADADVDVLGDAVDVEADADGAVDAVVPDVDGAVDALGAPPPHAAKIGSSKAARPNHACRGARCNFIERNSLSDLTVSTTDLKQTDHHWWKGMRCRKHSVAAA